MIYLSRSYCPTSVRQLFIFQDFAFHVVTTKNCRKFTFVVEKASVDYCWFILLCRLTVSSDANKNISLRYANKPLL